MYVPASLLTLAIVLLNGSHNPVKAQSDPDDEKKVRIEVITTDENGTRTTTKEFDADDGSAMQEALRELGVMEHFSFNGDGGQIVIDIRDLEGFPQRDVMAFRTPAAWSAAGKPWFGITSSALADKDASSRQSGPRHGAHVDHVFPGSPAASMGLQQGDIITRMNGATIDAPGEIVDVVGELEVGDELDVTWFRDGKRMTGSTTVAAREMEDFDFNFRSGSNDGPAFFFGEQKGKRAFLGVTPGSADIEGKGVVIGSVEEGSAAGAMGIQAGDVIRTLNGEALSNFSELASAIKEMAPGDPVTVAVERNGQTIEMSGTLGERAGWTGGMERRFGFDGSGGDGLRIEMEQLRNDMERLREEMGVVRSEAPGQLRREMRITIQGRPLDQSEKDMLTQKGVVGLDKELTLGDLSCSPNPSSGFFRLRFDVSERGDLTVHVHDGAGEKIYDERIGEFKGRYERTLDLSDRAAGTYYLVIGQHGRTATQKLVKQ